MSENSMIGMVLGGILVLAPVVMVVYTWSLNPGGTINWALTAVGVLSFLAGGLMIVTSGFGKQEAKKESFVTS